MGARVDPGESAGDVRPVATAVRSDAPRQQSLADVTDHIVARFDGRIAPRVVARMVRHCNRELMLTQGRAAPDAVERLALRRLALRSPEILPAR